MDRYLAVLGENPDFARFKRPEDFYNKVQFDIDPPATSSDDDDTDEMEKSLTELADRGTDGFGSESHMDSSEFPTDRQDPDYDSDNTLDDDPSHGEGFREISRLARDFAVRILRFEERKGLPEILLLTASNIGVNLAGGHGLGYDEDTLCGNIVKCRWALADCEFCRELFEQLVEKTGEAEYVTLADESRALSSAIQERIERLRCRVWW
jgi:hypothetical protein